MTSKSPVTIPMPHPDIPPKRTLLRIVKLFDRVEKSARPRSWMMEPVSNIYTGGMRVFAAMTFTRVPLSAIEKLKGIRRRPAPKGVVPYTVWNR